MVRDGDDFYYLLRESCCHRTTQKAFCLLSQQTNGKFSRSPIFHSIYGIFSCFCIHLKVSIYCTHLYFCNDKNSFMLL